MSKIEIIINKEIDGIDASLSSLSINGTNALIEILTALRNIAVYENKPDIKIGLVEGSACAIFEGENETIEDIHTSIMKVVDNEPNRENIYVSNLQIIKDQIKNRGLEINVKYFHNNSEISLLNLFNEPFRKKREKKVVENNFNIEFFKGKLETNGGRTPNFHIVSNNDKFVISCTEQESQRVSIFQYKEFRFSAWAKMGSDGKMQYKFCDIYESTGRDFFAEFRDFFSELKNLNGSELIKKIHYKLKEFYSNGQFAESKKFIRIFINEYSDISALMSILIISKRFKHQEDLRDLLTSIENLIVNKTKKPVL